MKKISKPELWGAIFIVLAVFIAYWPALRGGFIWDDDGYVTHNQTLHNLNGLQEIWFNAGATPQYYPLVFTTFWLEYHLWGLNPLGFHLVNVLLHALGSLLLWRVLAQLKVPGAWLAAAIFALHPVQVESVAWITERKNVLSAVFYFLAALAYLRFINTENSGSADIATPILLFCRIHLVRRCTFKQNGDLFVTGGPVAGVLVEKRPIATAGYFVVAPIFFGWHGFGACHGMAGEKSRRRTRYGLVVDLDGTFFGRQAGPCVFIPANCFVQPGSPLSIPAGK